MVNGFAKATPTGDWDSAEMKAMTDELLALTPRELFAQPNALGFLLYRLSVSKDKADRGKLLGALKSFRAGPDATTEQKNQITSRLILQDPDVTLAQAKAMLGTMPYNNTTAAAAPVVAARFADPKIRDDWFASAKGKGISHPSYQAWFRKHITDMTDADRALAVHLELVGLIRNGADIAQAKAWIDELRYRTYVAKELETQP